MNPELLKALDRLLGRLESFARCILIGKPGAQLVPFFILFDADWDAEMVVTPFRDGADKRRAVDAVRARIRRPPEVKAVAFAAEAWMLEFGKNEPPPAVAPSESERRVEIVNAAISWPGGEKVRVWRIVRDDAGVVVDLVDIAGPEPLASLGGMMHGLFE